MGGHKIATLVDGVNRVLGKMSSLDRFRVVTFNQKAHDFSGGYVQATPENLQHMMTRVKGIQAGGSTALHAGLEMAYNGLDRDRVAGMILATDGVANVGPSTHAELMNLHRRHDVRLFTFVIGNSANRPLLNNLAKASGGFAMNISSSDDIVGRIIQARAKVLHQALYDADLTIRGERVVNLTPAKIGNLHVGQQLVLFGQYDEAGDVDIEFSGRIAGERKTWRTKTHLPETATDYPEIERLWALSMIDETMDTIRDKGETAGRREKIVDLGTRYALVTDYTSMVVLDEAEMEGAGIERNNADRVEKERRAQTQRALKPVENHRVDHKPDGSGMFGNASSPGIGTGPVGPLFVGLALFLRRKKRKL
jgi:Ca-activated chloride channel family protein